MLPDGWNFDRAPARTHWLRPLKTKGLMWSWGLARAAPEGAARLPSLWCAKRQCGQGVRARTC